METTYGFVSLLPPLLAICLALLTRQVILSLLAGLWLGFVILAEGNPLTGTFDTLNGLVNVFSSAYNTQIIFFTLIVGALITLIQRSGGVQGFVNRLLSWLERGLDNAETRGQRVRVELFSKIIASVSPANGASASARPLGWPSRAFLRRCASSNMARSSEAGISARDIKCFGPVIIFSKIKEPTLLRRDRIG